MDAKSVARLGYRGFRRGRVIVIPGLKNKLGAFAVRLAPASLDLPLYRHYNKA